MSKCCFGFLFYSQQQIRASLPKQIPNSRLSEFNLQETRIGLETGKCTKKEKCHSQVSLRAHNTVVPSYCTWSPLVLLWLCNVTDLCPLPLNRCMFTD